MASPTAGEGRYTTIEACGARGCSLRRVDPNEFEQGRCLPGSRIPIRPVEWGLEERPDHVLVPAWNFAEEIMEQQSEYRARGGRFVLPVPTPRLV